MGKFDSSRPIRNALEDDLELLKSQDALRGREALVTLARQMSDVLDAKKFSSPASYVKTFHEVLNSLGIGRTDAEPDDDAFADLIKKMKESSHG